MAAVITTSTMRRKYLGELDQYVSRVQEVETALITFKAKIKWNRESYNVVPQNTVHFLSDELKSRNKQEEVKANERVV